MDSVLALRPFVPAKDFDLSKRFYQAMDFVVTYEDESIAVLKMESSSFILQKFYVEDHAAAHAVDEIAADTWSANAEAQQFFASRGFDSFRIRIRKAWLRAPSPKTSRE